MNVHGSTEAQVLCTTSTHWVVGVCGKCDSWKHLLMLPYLRLDSYYSQDTVTARVKTGSGSDGQDCQWQRWSRLAVAGWQRGSRLALAVMVKIGSGRDGQDWQWQRWPKLEVDKTCRATQ
jgi:hypothetical protein